MARIEFRRPLPTLRVKQTNYHIRYQLVTHYFMKLLVKAEFRTHAVIAGGFVLADSVWLSIDPLRGIGDPDRFGKEGSLPGSAVGEAAPCFPPGCAQVCVAVDWASQNASVSLSEARNTIAVDCR
jgi:hypothetical protein